MLRAHEMPEQCSKIFPNYKDFHNSVKFDLGSVYDVFKLHEASSGEQCKPPYPVSLFQFTADSTFCLYFVLVKDTGTSIECYCFGKEPDQDNQNGVHWYQECKTITLRNGYRLKRINDMVLTKNGKAAPYNPSILDENRRMADLWWFERTFWVASALDTIARSNTIIVDNEPSEKLNKKRLKKGKSPFYSYKTLHIKPIETTLTGTLPKGGTHASPRVHLRRGHIRHMTSGRDIWVSPCVVGNKENGLVEKDYRIETNSL